MDLYKYNPAGNYLFIKHNTEKKSYNNKDVFKTTQKKKNNKKNKKSK
jgi:hypothetical protein